jgi:hypothetical protein
MRCATSCRYPKRKARETLEAFLPTGHDRGNFGLIYPLNVLIFRVISGPSAIDQLAAATEITSGAIGSH